MSNVINSKVFNLNAFPFLRKGAACFFALWLLCPVLLFGADEERSGTNSAVQPSKKISGTVVDKDGFPMPGVTIQIKGKTTGVAMLHVSQYDVTF